MIKLRGHEFFENDLELTKKSLRLVNVMKILEKLFLKYEQSLNSISFIRSQNINCAMPRWEENEVCHQKDITVGIMFMKTTRNTCKNQKNSEEKCEKVSKSIKP